jgi:oxygen-independent coproporphyrinogen-3 oxidase
MCAEVEEQYVQTLLKEIDLVHAAIGQAHVNQIHFGGGTPTKLHPSQLTRLVCALKERFSIAPGAEIAIEVDPRTVVGKNTPTLSTLKALGFTRISLGIQDFNAQVQNAIGRRQSEQVSTQVYRQCQELGVDSINFDLVYGLPCQTVLSFQETINRVIALHPSRIALFSFAYLPELKPLQKAIPPSLLSSPEEKFEIYCNAQKSLLQAGYVGIGLDHFALPEDALSQSVVQGTLRRTFQGYTAVEGHEVIGLGMTAISDLGTAFFQHAKTLPEYCDAIDSGKFPTARGLVLSQDDLRRRFVIEQLMCRGAIQKKAFEEHTGEPFDAYFHTALDQLQPLINDGLVSCSDTTIEATHLGRLFLRNIAACFDAYLYPNKLKNREFANDESPRFDSEKTSSTLDIGAVFSESKMGLSAKAKTDSSACLGIEPSTLSSRGI